MAYTIIQPPFTLKFREMSKKELNAYREWFLDAIPTRIGELTREVRGTPSFDSWEPNMTPESLDVLGVWFEHQVKVRPLTKEELRAGPSWISGPNYELINRTFSLALDIGMYLSQVVLKSRPDVQWEQPTKDKKFADYGQVVLVGLGPVPMNPVRLAVNLAYGIAAGSQGGSRLRELFDYWVKTKSK